MLFATEAVNVLQQSRVERFLVATEDNAAAHAGSFALGSTVRLGAVRPRPHGGVFSVEGEANGEHVAFDVLVPRGMPQADCWCTWSLMFEQAGLVVEEDAAYISFLDGVLE